MNGEDTMSERDRLIKMFGDFEVIEGDELPTPLKDIYGTVQLGKMADLVLADRRSMAEKIRKPLNQYRFSSSTKGSNADRAINKSLSILDEIIKEASDGKE